MQITNPGTIAAGGYQVVDVAGLQLEGAGDQVWLVAADATGRPLAFVDHIQFGPSLGGVSLGPSVLTDEGFVQLDRVTLGGPNAGPRVNEVVLSEVYYQPTDPDGVGSLKPTDFEFVELYNRTGSAVDISGWQITGDISFTFPAQTVMGPGATLTVVPFAPTDARATAFRFTLGMDAAAP